MPGDTELHGAGAHGPDDLILVGELRSILVQKKSTAIYLEVLMTNAQIFVPFHMAQASSSPHQGRYPMHSTLQECRQGPG